MLVRGRGGVESERAMKMREWRNRSSAVNPSGAPLLPLPLPALSPIIILYYLLSLIAQHAAAVSAGRGSLVCLDFLEF